MEPLEGPSSTWVDTERYPTWSGDGATYLEEICKAVAEYEKQFNDEVAFGAVSMSFLSAFNFEFILRFVLFFVRLLLLYGSVVYFSRE